VVFKNAVHRLIEVVQQVLADAQLPLDAIDRFFFHQANLRINRMVARELGIPEHKVPHQIQRYGNTTAATLPLLLDEAVRTGDLQPGMRCVFAAFGSGFTWGAAVYQHR